MGALIPYIQSLGLAGEAVWIIFILVFISFIIMHGHKWLDVIMRNNNEHKRILSDDKRKNEKHASDMNERQRKIEERKAKQLKAEGGKK